MSIKCVVRSVIWSDEVRVCVGAVIVCNCLQLLVWYVLYVCVI